MTIEDRIQELFPPKDDVIQLDDKSTFSDSLEYMKQTGVNFGIDLCKKALTQAVKDGKIILNPPSEEELSDFLLDWDKIDLSTGDAISLAKGILERLRQ